VTSSIQPKTGREGFREGKKAKLQLAARGVRPAFRRTGRVNGSPLVIWIATPGAGKVKLFMALEFNLRFMGFAFVTLGCLSCMGQIPQQTTVPSPENNRAGRGIALAGESRPAQPLSGSVSGTVADQSGAVVAGAHVRLTGEDQSPSQEVLSGDDGQFSFANVAPGPFQLTIAST
jgi:hypothetical protein